MTWFKSLLRPVWQSYLKCCHAQPWLALPMPNGLAEAGAVWCHPEFFRHKWSSDEDKVFATLMSLITPRDVVFDIGANIGQTAIVSARCVGKDGCVVAFEPSTPNVNMLNYHLRWNRIKNVRVEAVCVGNSVGTVNFFIQGDGQHSSNSLTFSDAKNAALLEAKPRAVQVPITTIDAYCLATGVWPKIMKIDVEGAELDVLKGARAVLTSHRPKLLLGVHPFWWPEGQPSNALGEFLKDLNYRVLVPGTDQEAELKDFADYVCVPKESVA